MLAVTCEKTVSAAAPILIPTGRFQDQPSFALDLRCVLVGASEQAELQLFFGGVREAHALIVSTASGVYARNFAGREELRVNGLPIVEHFLNDGDTIQFGQFTFRFRAHQVHFKTRTPPPPIAVQVAGEAARPIAGRVALIGTGQAIVYPNDIQLDPWGEPEIHAALFAADGQWFVRNLSSTAGVSVSGLPVRTAEVRIDDLLRVAGKEIRLLQATQSMPGPADSRRYVDNPPTETFLGGMPVNLPEVGPPAGFGKIGISFGDRTLVSKRSAPVPVRPPPELDPEPIAEAPPEPKTAPKPAFRLPPRVILTKPPAPQETEDQAPEPDYAPLDAFSMPQWDGLGDESEFPAGVQDAVFGSMPLPGGGEEYVPDLSGSVAPFSTEMDDFADSEFWNRTEQDDSDVPLPARQKDWAPEIPPTEMSASAGFTPVHDRTFEPRLRASAAERGVPPAFRKSDGTPFTTTLGPSRSRSKSAAPKAWAIGLATATAASVVIWFAVPTHATIEGRLRFLNTPADGTPAWQTFESDVRTRLGDPVLAASAAEKLDADRPGLSPGFLSDDQAKRFSQVTQAAVFETEPSGRDLVLRVNGNDPANDSERLLALFKALYANESDLVSAAASARQALSDWLPSVAAKQTEVDETQRRIDQQQKLIDAAKRQVQTLGPLLNAAMDAASRYVAAEQAVQADQSRLDQLNAQLNAPAASTKPVAPVAVDRRFGDDDVESLSSRIQQLSEQIDAVKSLSAQDSVDPLVPKVNDAQHALDRDSAAAQSLLLDHPDLQQAIAASDELQERVRDLIGQMIDHRQQTLLKLQEMSGLLAQTSRLREQISLHVKSRSAFVDRRRVDKGLHLRNQLGRLIDGAAAQLTDDCQLIDVTLQTQQARLAASGIPPDLAPNQRAAMDKVVQDTDALAQIQSAFAAAVAQPDQSLQVLPALLDERGELERQAAAPKGAAATPVKNDALRRSLTAARDELLKRVNAELTDVAAAQDEFYGKASAATAVAATIQSARQAEQNMGVLMEARDAKMGDLNAVQMARDDLQQKIATTTDLKSPTEADVQVISDNTNRKLTYMGTAFLAISLLVGLLGTAIGKPRRPQAN